MAIYLDEKWGTSLAQNYPAELWDWPVNPPFNTQTPFDVTVAQYDAAVGRYVGAEMKQNNNFNYEYSVYPEYQRLIKTEFDSCFIYEPPHIAPGERSLPNYIEYLDANIAYYSKQLGTVDPEDTDALRYLIYDLGMERIDYAYFMGLWKGSSNSSSYIKLEAHVKWKEQRIEQKNNFLNVNSFLTDPFWQALINAGNALFKIGKFVIDKSGKVIEKSLEVIDKLPDLIEDTLNYVPLMVGGGLLLGALIVFKK